MINTLLWCPEGDLNPHDRLGSADFKSAVSADFTMIIKDLVHATEEMCNFLCKYEIPSGAIADGVCKLAV